MKQKKSTVRLHVFSLKLWHEKWRVICTPSGMLGLYFYFYVLMISSGRLYLLSESPPRLRCVLEHSLSSSCHAAQSCPALPHGGHGATDGGLAGVAPHQFQLRSLFLQTTQLVLKAIHKRYKGLKHHKKINELLNLCLETPEFI